MKHSVELGKMLPCPLSSDAPLRVTACIRNTSGSQREFAKGLRREREHLRAGLVQEGVGGIEAERRSAACEGARNSTALKC